MKRIRTKHFSKRGMALIELIIAMTILATLATIAIITADDLGEITRYEETERRGNAIQKGVVGNDGEISRFANDMGRFPVILLTPANNEEIEQVGKKFLAELYDLVDKDGDIYSYDNAQRMKKRECSLTVDLTKIESESDTPGDFTSVPTALPTEVKMSAGWDGPYVLNQNSADELTDNWGHYWDIFHESTLTDAGGNAVEKWAKNLAGDVYSADSTNTEGELELGTEILGVRSWYKEEYKDELAFLFPKNRLFVNELQVELVDASGVPLSAANYSTVKIFVYLPYCPTKQVENGNNTDAANFPFPQIAEFCIWKNTTTNANGFRLRVDTNFDGTIAADGSEHIRADASIPELIRTRVDLGSAFSSFTLKDFPVGTRKIWAYAKSSSGNTGIFAPVRAYEIKPSTGILKIYLNETFNF